MKYLLSLCIALSVISCICDSPKLSLVDKNATEKTVNLYKNLYELGCNKKILLGHHETTAYGVGWVGDKDRSDIKSICEKNVAMYSWDIAGLEYDSDVCIDGVPFDRVRDEFIAAYERGSVNTFCWHAIHPIKGNSWVVGDSIVKELLPNATLHTQYVSWLDKISTYFDTLVDINGEPIPFIFRPFHENNGKWFWWGAPYCTPEEFKELWRFTVSYLRDVKEHHNILYCFSPNHLATEREYLEYYPGDDYVDIWGTDTYCMTGMEVEYQFAARAAIASMSTVAKESNKPFALTETGYEGVKNPKWYTEVLMPIIEHTDISYLVLWRNADSVHHYASYPGHLSESDFIDFVNSPKILMEGDVKYLYE